MDEAYRLVTGALSLRPYTPDDAERVYEAVRESIAELSKWMPWAHPDYSIDDTRKWIEHCGEEWAEGTEYNFAITDAKDGIFLGGCGLNKVSREVRRANLGYWVRSTRTGQGTGTAAALLVARFGFEELGLERIEIGAATQNRASQRVAEKLGAVRDRTQEKWVAVGDRIYDALIFTLTRQALDRPDRDRRTDTQGSSQWRLPKAVYGEHIEPSTALRQAQGERDGYCLRHGHVLPVGSAALHPPYGSHVLQAANVGAFN